MTDTPEDPGSEPDVAADIGPDPQAGLVEVLVAAGLDSDEVERARVHGHLELLALDHLVLPEHAPFDVVQVAETTGVPQELVARLWRSLGFADPQPGEQIFLPVDVDIIRAIGELLAGDLLAQDLTLQMARVIGSSLARIATAMVDAVSPDDTSVSESPADGQPGQGTSASARAAGSEDGPNLVATLQQVIDVVWRRHVQAEARARMSRDRRDLDPTRRVVGFADLVGFTALSQQIESHELASVVERFEAIAYDTIGSRGGRVVKMIGDEVMFAVDDPAAAVDIALSLAESYRRDDELSDVRVGLAAGPVVTREGDLFGPVVNRASRIVNIAFPGTVVCSPELQEALEDQEGLDWRSIGHRGLKDIGRLQLYVVRWADDPGRIRSRLEESQARRSARREAVVEQMERRRGDRRPRSENRGDLGGDGDTP